MKTAKIFSSVLVMGLAVGLSSSARADGESLIDAPTMEGQVAVAPTFVAPAQGEDDQPSHGKPGLVATGIVLSILGAGHIALGTAVLATHHDCTGQEFICFSGLDYPVAAVSFGIGAALMAVGVPLLVYGATAKPNQPHAQVGVSPTGLTFSGTF